MTSLSVCPTISGGTNRKKLKNTSICHGVILPEDIMMFIVTKLDMEHLHCFSAVCKSWQSIAIASKKIRRLHLRPQIPWLMLSSLEDNNLWFFSLSRSKLFRLEFPEVYGARCYGSNWGWLIMVNKMGRNFLLHPFTRVLNELPPQGTFPIQHPSYASITPSFNHIFKAILLSPPPDATTNNSDLDDKNIVSSVAMDCGVVVAIYSINDLAFCRPGDEVWTALGKGFEDIIFYDGKLYGFTKRRDLKIVELGPHPKVTSCNITPPEEDDISISINLGASPPAEEDLGRLPTNLLKSFYLVECLGELLMVIKYCLIVNMTSNVMLKIFKLDQKSRNWIKVVDLGDQMLFIGAGSGLSVSATDYPGFRGNCIYFTDHDHYSSFETQVCGTLAKLFHLEDNSIEPIFSNHSSPAPSPPIWFTPIS
ncbi:putative F-box protein At5g55150 [Macadamia integrifolia]|uniref:putative F-box protein At5g55150 n=1 Tax=Macadamia integrifolia TaxID=60698 RepID=UPI001C4FBDEE|nr:putative F-box protein At5g55150 [Macadamia integrifolia]XP_042486787.1 putative F-box protein At5g55150 [Macadamia integrifolia]